MTGSVGPANVMPTATLACPIVSALDRWITEAVQPAAQRWFAQPVIEIKQISAYSCRGMNGQPGARISEHAFGNALDIAAFTLADGHTITVKNGWRGTPEEQGFLHDVQVAACEQFTTVLAPGSNVFHYDHIHVDLMRRASGRRICQPAAIPGEVVAARARARYAAKSRGDTSDHRLDYAASCAAAGDPDRARWSRRGRYGPRTSHCRSRGGLIAATSLTWCLNTTYPHCDTLQQRLCSTYQIQIESQYVGQ